MVKMHRKAILLVVNLHTANKPEVGSNNMTNPYQYTLTQPKQNYWNDFIRKFILNMDVYYATSSTVTEMATKTSVPSAIHMLNNVWHK